MAEDYANFDEAMREAQRLVERFETPETKERQMPAPEMTPHVEQRLGDDAIIWLGTVRPDGRPHLVPVWFIWDGSTMLIFSQPGSRKVANLRRNPHVTLALETGGTGADVIVIEGEAVLVDGLAATAVPAYAEKYGEQMALLGYDPESLAQAYSQAIRISPMKVRAS